MTYSGHTSDIGDACFHDNHVITGSSDGSLRLFDLETGNCLYAFFNHRSENFNAVAVNSTGDMVLGANSNGMLYTLVPYSDGN